ncbi:MAG: type II toxin-antitoxin system VapC family toxin [Acidimicrobiia bacterium]|nr:type II toxin-antitoxin system VapC family toxin [Acidimicrobiia bacterium]
MPPPKEPSVYVDACVLLAYVSNEENRAAAVQSVLDDARTHKINLFTSVLSITEVAYVAADNAEQSTSEDSIDQLWTPASPIALIDIYQRVAREARSVIRQARVREFGGVRSADAIHLASARLQRCSRFFTYEKEATRERWDSLISARVSEPYTDSPRLGFR